MPTEQPHPVVFDADEASFERLVLERSRSIPVLVDFWAPWCGPCRTLSPLLEELAHAGGGRWALAKVDTDACPTLAQHFGIRGIPNVKAIVDGRYVDEFTGALPRAEVEAFLARIVPSEEDQQVLRAEERIASGDLEPARTTLEAVIAAELAALRARADAAPDDLGARLDLGRAAAGQGDYELAAESFLTVLARDRSFQEGAAQAALRDLLALMGDSDPRAEALRRRMASLLFA